MGWHDITLYPWQYVGVNYFWTMQAGLLYSELKLNANEAVYMQNGSYRGFGFAECAAACEMKKQVQKAVKPHSLQESFTDTVTSEKQTLAKCASMGNISSSMSFKSVPKRSSTMSTQVFTGHGNPFLLENVYLHLFILDM